MKLSMWLGVAAISLTLSAGVANAAEISGESCMQDDGRYGCDEGLCAIAGEFPGSQCSATDPKQCQCITGADCLADSDCGGLICDTTTWTCVPADDAGSGSDVASETDGGCATSGSALFGMVPVLASLLRRRNQKAS
jgi:hypothetical protein